MSRSSLSLGVFAALTAAALLSGCASPDGGSKAASSPSVSGAPAASTPTAAADPASGTPVSESPVAATPDGAGASGADAVAGTPGPEKVRDAFAGLQATLDGSCTPAECDWWISRVDREMRELGEAMRADPKGPGHFPEPLRWIKELDRTLGGDHSARNLRAHEKQLIRTRDRINTWMQDHPDDYR
ncbi:hypothetical protein ACN20G_35000 (plasmid) [Streptomyces sp. BI20]|uniref:hypothetical protein n=1 Tax=Streptomyces sp. BI20 TaxID=3403460 RepID=UPI003C78B673